jgi:hypothetical protein
MGSIWVEIIRRAHPELVRHVQVSKNFGLLGGWLHCEFWTFPSGDPVGLAQSKVLKHYPEHVG